MINREEALQEIYERLKANRTVLGLTTFKRTPTEPVREEDLPCIFMSEGTDTILDHSKRTSHGYPARRALEVIIELITDRDTDIRQLFLNVRSIIFTEIGTNPPKYNPILGANIFINENRTEGPMGYGLPDVLGMRLILDLVYTDKGFY